MAVLNSRKYESQSLSNTRMFDCGSTGRPFDVSKHRSSDEYKATSPTPRIHLSGSVQFINGAGANGRLVVGEGGLSDRTSKTVPHLALWIYNFNAPNHQWNGQVHVMSVHQPNRYTCDNQHMSLNRIHQEEQITQVNVVHNHIHIFGRTVGWVLVQNKHFNERIIQVQTIFIY